MKKILLALILLTLLTAFVTARVAPRTEIKTTSFQPITINDNIELPISYGLIYGLSIDADVSLTGEDSNVRVVLVTDKEYLVYEGYGATYTDTEHLIDYCEESCNTGRIGNAILRITVTDGTLILNNINPITRGRPNTKEARDQERINKINSKNLGWTAGHTSISRMTFQQKKDFLGRTPAKYNGFEYYKGGVFKIDNTHTAPPSSESLLPKTWDWRNVHGENWLTSVKDQASCGSCVFFAVVGTTEMLVNQYFNQHIDLDLSEQQIISCGSVGSCATGANPATVANYIVNNGAIEEECFPYTATDSSCSLGCSDPQVFVQPSSRGFYRYEEELKRYIIEGAVSGVVNSWWHDMVMIGYDHTDELVWIFKNSWGEDWGDNGIAYLSGDFRDFSGGSPLLYPVINNQGYTIRCVDNDGDGFYNWGNSQTRPDTCPDSVQRDCNDADSNLTEMNENYNCVVTVPPTPDPDPVYPTIRITRPSDGETVFQRWIHIRVSTTNTDYVNFYANGNLVHTDTRRFSYKLSPSRYTRRIIIMAEAVAENGLKANDTVTVLLNSDRGRGSRSRGDIIRSLGRDYSRGTPLRTRG